MENEKPNISNRSKTVLDKIFGPQFEDVINSKKQEIVLSEKEEEETKKLLESRLGFQRTKPNLYDQRKRGRRSRVPSPHEPKTHCPCLCEQDSFNNLDTLSILALREFCEDLDGKKVSKFEFVELFHLVDLLAPLLQRTDLEKLVRKIFAEAAAKGKDSVFINGLLGICSAWTQLDGALKKLLVLSLLADD